MRARARLAALTLVLALGACGGGEDAAPGDPERSPAEQAASKRHDFAALERCVRGRADEGTVESVDAIRGLTSLADDAFLVTGLPSSPVQSAVIAADDDAHALAAALRQLNYGFVDQQGVNVVIAWQRVPEPGDRAVIEPCL